MSNFSLRHCLEGLEPDNLLAFLALLGLLRALETSRPEWFPRAAWDLDQPPPRPILTLAEPVSRGLICEAAAGGVATLVAAIDFASATDLKLNVSQARSLCRVASEGSAAGGRYFAELCAALISDAATDPEQTKVEPTPLAYPVWPQATSSRISWHCPRESCPRKAAVTATRHTQKPRPGVLRRHCSRHGGGLIGRSAYDGIPMRRGGTPIAGGHQPKTRRQPSMGQIG
jgi:hypothetical protein